MDVQETSRPHRAASEQSPSTRSLASSSVEDDEASASNKELSEWLRQHPTYGMDMTGFTPVRRPPRPPRRPSVSVVSHRSVSPLQKSDELLLSQFSKPKQKRHRCRNPNKIDINTLTGEERVPVVNRRNGRKVNRMSPDRSCTCTTSRSAADQRRVAARECRHSCPLSCRWAGPWLLQ